MFNFFSNFETYKVDFEIYLEDKLIQRQTAEAPKEMLIATFAQTRQQIAQDKRAMKLIMKMPVVIYDNFEGKEKTIENEVVFSNKAMIAFEENKQESS